MHRFGPPSGPTGTLVPLLGTDGAALVRSDGFVAWRGRGAAVTDGPASVLRWILHPASPCPTRAVRPREPVIVAVRGSGAPVLPIRVLR